MKMILIYCLCWVVILSCVYLVVKRLPKQSQRIPYKYLGGRQHTLPEGSVLEVGKIYRIVGWGWLKGIECPTRLFEMDKLILAGANTGEVNDEFIAQKTLKIKNVRLVRIGCVGIMSEGGND